MPAKATAPNFRLAVFWALIAWLGFSLAFLFAKTIHQHTTISVMAFFRSLIGTLVLFPFLWRRRKEGVFPQRPWVMFFRSAVSLTNIVLIFWSLKTISLVDSTLLLNSAPFFVPFLAWISLKHPINHRLWIPIAIGFIGIAFILKPDRNVFEPGSLFAVAAGCSTAVSTILVRVLTGSEKVHLSTFYTFAIALVLVTPFAIFNWRIDDPIFYLPLVGIGCGVLLGQWGFFKALRYAKPAQVAPFGYAAVAYSAVFDFLFFHQVPGIYSIIGFLLIIGAGMAVLRAGNP